jgi:hypothetical protein
LLLLLLLLLHQLRKYRYTLKSHRLPLLVVIRSNYNIYTHTHTGRQEHNGRVGDDEVSWRRSRKRRSFNYFQRQIVTRKTTANR